MVDLTADAGVVNADGADPTVRASLIRLAFASTAAIATCLWLAEVIVCQVDRSQEFSTFAPFNGWQVWAVEGGLGAAFAIAAGLSLRAAVLLIRQLRGRTPYRRLMCIVALLPGLLAGGAAASPIRSAVSWASDHTSEAAHFAAQLRQERVDYRKHPPVLRGFGSPAPAAVAAKLLHPSDLGVGWYDGMTPNPRRIGMDPEMTRLGGFLAASMDLAQQTWDGQSWQLRALILQSVRQFPSGAAARSFATLQINKTATEARQRGVPPASIIKVRTVTVHEWKRARGRLAAWRAGVNYYTLNATDFGEAPPAADFDHWVRLAVDLSAG